MSDFQLQVENIRDKAVKVLRKWERDKAAKEVMREYLSEEGKNGKSKLDNLLERMETIALTSEDLEISRKATKDMIEMAAGSEKVTNVQNNQFNFGDFLNKI